MDKPSIFAERLRETMRNSGKIQQDIAEHLGVDRTTVSHWMRGKHSPNLIQLKQLAQLLGVTADHLLGLEKETWFYKISPDTRDFIKQEVLDGRPVYIETAKYAKRASLSPEVIRTLSDAFSEQK